MKQRLGLRAVKRVEALAAVFPLIVAMRWAAALGQQKVLEVLRLKVTALASEPLAKLEQLAFERRVQAWLALLAQEPSLPWALLLAQSIRVARRYSQMPPLELRMVEAMPKPRATKPALRRSRSAPNRRALDASVVGKAIRVGWQSLPGVACAAWARRHARVRLRPVGVRRGCKT